MCDPTAGNIAAFIENYINNLFSLLLHLRQHHHLSGGKVRAPRWPLSPAAAHTHITLTPGHNAHAATKHYTSSMSRGQVRPRHDHPSGEAFAPIVHIERIEELLTVRATARLVGALRESWGAHAERERERADSVGQRPGA